MNILKFQPDLSLFDKGLYTVAEAASLTGVPAATFHRWVFGYTRNRSTGRIDYEPLAEPEIGRIDGIYAVGFRDLLEARIVQAFREAGVSWKVIRLAAKNIRAMGYIRFYRNIFERTAGRFSRNPSEKPANRSFSIWQETNTPFTPVIAPSLFKQIEFDSADLAVRWYPLWPRKIVVLDPNRSFGRPLVANVPADTLAAAARAENSAEAAAVGSMSRSNRFGPRSTGKTGSRREFSVRCERFAAPCACPRCALAARGSRRATPQGPI